MKGLFSGVAFLAVLGICSFLYRYTLEHPVQKPNAMIACTAEARVCPDGSSVARTGTGCAFAACPLPNRELPDAGIAFVIPAGYTENAAAVTPDSDLLIALEKPSASQSPHSIVVRRLAVPAGKTAEDVMIAQTQYESSGANPKSMSEFSPITVNGHTFQSLTVERLEGQVHTLYYLPRANDVLRFEVLERDVTGWTNPKLVVSVLPEHAALLRMLGTLQVK